MQRGAGCRGCTSTAEPRNASTPQHPQTRASTMPTARPPQVPGGQLRGMEAPAQNAPYSERWEGISRSSEIGDREVVPCCTHTHAHTQGFVQNGAFRMEMLELDGKASARQKMLAWISTQQHCLSATGAAKWEEQTRMDGTWDKVAMHRRTFPLAAAAVTACGRKRGGDAHDPQKCTQLGKKRCFRD